MYTGLPTRERRAVKTALALSWAFAGAAGLVAVLASPVTIVAELGFMLTILSGSLLMVSSLVAGLGVALNRYRWEWVASWFAAAALVPYGATVWTLVITDTWTRLTQACLITALVGFFIARSMLCAAHAAKLRGAHDAAESVARALAEGGANASGVDAE